MNKPRQYSRQLKQFKKGYMSVTLYLNRANGTKYYDTVIHRRCKRNNKQEYIRGANLKPDDVADLIELLKDVSVYLSGLGVLSAY